MCIENEIMNDLEKEKDEIMKAVKIIKDFGPSVCAINVMLEELARRLNEEKEDRVKAIEQEKVDREKEDCEIKTNYIKRFDKIDKMLLSLFFTIISMFLGSTVFILLNAIYKWIIF